MNWLRLTLLLTVLSLSLSLAEESILPSASPVTFLQNNGQWQSEILFKGTSTSPVSFLKDGISFGQSRKESIDSGKNDSFPFIVWNLKFVDPGKACKVTGVNGKNSVYSYLSGNNPEKWIIHPKEFSQINYEALFEKVDLRFYGIGNALKYDFIVHPGGSMKAIKACYEGVKQIGINKNEELEVTTTYDTQIQRKPIAWQIINGVKEFVVVKYSLINDSTFGFVAPDGYNSQYDLIIDPLFQMVWSSYTNIPGGNNNINYCYSNAMDLDGNVYLTGMVDGTFPITPGAYSGPGNVFPEVFVAKFSSDGTTLLYWTYLPGNSSEFGVGIAVDSLGRAYVTGTVDLNITGMTNFPSTPNAYQPVHNTGADAFLTVVNAAGSGLDYATFLGGTGSETGYDIALGPTGIAYVTGYTSLGNFPVTASTAFPTGDNDLFVAKFDINQTGANSLVYSTRIGAGSFKMVRARSIAVNDSGNVFVTGTISSSFGTPTYPITAGAYNSVFNTGQDGVMCFVTKLSATTPVTLDYSTYVAPGTGNGIAVDKLTDEVVITGSTYTFTFPVTPGALQPVHAGAGGTDAFALKLNAAGNNLVYSTFLGGPNYDYGTAVVLNAIGEAYVTGLASDDFPTSTGSFQPDFAGGLHDFFVVHLNTSGTGYSCGGSTLVGGSDEDYTGSFVDYPAPQISLRDHGGVNDSISISATTHSQDFPTTPGSYGPVKVNGIADQPVFFKMTCEVTAVLPVADFNTSVINDCDSVFVNFTDATANNPTSWQWNFPGASPGTSALQNPQGIYFPNTGNYVVSLIVCNSAGCDSIAIPVQINAPQPVVVSIGNDTTICNGATLTLDAGNTFNTYQWQLNGNNIGSSSSVSAAQSGQYTLTVTNTSGCAGFDTLNLAISNPVISAGPDLGLCNSDSALISVTAGFSLYQWQLNGTVLPLTNASIYVSQPGSYSVTATDSFGCTAGDTVLVTTNTISINLINDTAFCSGNTLTIYADPGYSTYQWQLNNTTIANGDSLTISQSGNYFLTVTTANGCSATDNVVVTVNNLPQIQTTGNTQLCQSQVTTLTATGAAVYAWSPATFLSSPDSAITLCSPSGTISYTVTGTDLNGCSNSATVNVVVYDIPEASFEYTLNYGCNGIALSTENNSINAAAYYWSFGDGNISNEVNPIHYYQALQNQTIQLIAVNGICSDTVAYGNISFTPPEMGVIPKVITPNGDGKNDCFEIQGIELYHDCYGLDVFNRWGNLVYTSVNTDNCWDGSSENSGGLPDGVYFYVINIASNTYKGTIMLMR
ncbi:MAG TPA: gliding motility-associated C-terminal domain-containing protein [Bacteroidia bacterium]|nr:gliding motility-associated C-terminal domain-containing protein [Bacteroidia bacterium]